MANVRIPDEGPMRPGADDENGVTRRDALVNGAKLVVAAGIGAQIMAATGAETAVAKQVRSVAGRAAGKPGYGPLVKTGPMQLPAGFQAFEFGKAGSPMSDGLKTPKHHDGSAVFEAGNDRADADPEPGERRPRQGARQAQRLRPSRQGRGDGFPVRHAERRAGRQRPRPQRHRQQLQRRPDPVGHVADLRGVHRRQAQGIREGARLRLRDPEGRQRTDRAEADQGDGPVRPRGVRGRPEDGDRLHDRGQRARRLLPLHPRTIAAQLHRGGKLQMLCVNGRSKYNTVTGQKVGKKLPLRVGDDQRSRSRGRRAPRAPASTTRAASKGAARFMGLEGASWGQGSVWFTASEAGDIYRGQVWRYTPATNIKHGTLELDVRVVESRRSSISPTRSGQPPGRRPAL